jgi:DNA-binding IclR family transcriptional regulator
VATGKALLAYADDAVRESLISRGLTQYTPLTHVEPDDFLQDMARIRALGCAVNTGEWRTEVRGVAAPVFDASGRAAAAIGVCSPASRMPDARLGEACALVVEVASRLSAHLGGALPIDRFVNVGEGEGSR